MLKELQVIGCRSYRSQAEVATGHRLQELQVIMLKELQVIMLKELQVIDCRTFEAPALAYQYTATLLTAGPKLQKLPFTGSAR
jgi:hypothetical protein